MKKYAFILVLISFPVCNAEIILTEVMYNPNGPDTYNEYLELYNSGNTTINMENYTICNSKLHPGYINNNLIYRNISFNLTPNSFALITDGGSGTEVYNTFNVSNYSLALHVSSSSICGSLSNSGDTIFLNNKSINYSPLSGADGDGNSLYFFNNIWIPYIPSPGYNLTIKTVNENSTNPDKSNSTNDSNKECDLGIKIYSERVLDSEIQSTYYLYLKCNEEGQYADVKYWIEDLFGDYIRKPKNTRINSNQNKSRSFTPKRIYGTESYLIKAEIINKSCDSDNSNNKYEFLIGIKGLEEEDKVENKTNKKEITLKIIDYPKEVKQGDNLTISFKLKNPTDRSEELDVYSYIYFNQELASEKGWSPNKRNILLEKNQETEFRLQNQIKEDAEPTFWNIKVKAKSEEIEIEDKNEIRITKKEPKKIKEEKVLTEEIKLNDKDNGNIVYVSEKENYLDISKYLLVPVIVFLSIISLVELRKDNFLKELLSPTSNGQRRNKTKNKGRSSKSQSNHRNSRNS